MAKKGYPRTRFDIVDQTASQEIATAITGSESLPLAMAAYTSNKGSENWKVFTNLQQFLDETGAVSFVKHGQPQLTVIEILRNGGAVFCKRLVSKDATLANATLRARIVTLNRTATTKPVYETNDDGTVKTDASGNPIQATDENGSPLTEEDSPALNVSFVYYYIKSIVNAKTFEEAYTEGYKNPGSEIFDQDWATSYNHDEIRYTVKKVIKKEIMKEQTRTISVIVDPTTHEPLLNDDTSYKTPTATPNEDGSYAHIRDYDDGAYVSKTSDGTAEGTIEEVLKDIELTETVGTGVYEDIITTEEVVIPAVTGAAGTVNVIDVPLFTVAPKGRGVSELSFRLTPEYASSRTAEYIRYTFDVYEDDKIIESIPFTLNPNIIINGSSQGLNPRIKITSKQVQVHLHEDGLYAFVSELAKNAINPDSSNSSSIAAGDLINMDVFNAKNRRGRKHIGGICTIVQASVAANSTNNINPEYAGLWNDFKPSDVTCIDTKDYQPLPNGDYGALGEIPIGKDFATEKTYPDEYVNLLLDTFGRVINYDEDEDISNPPDNFDAIIYDLDAYKIDFICDCAYPISVKNQIIDLCEYRQDMMFFADLGLKVNNLTAIRNMLDIDFMSEDYDETNLIQQSKFVALYHNYFKIYDPYTAKQITVTLPFLLGIRIIDHIKNGVGRPFAGILNGISFPEIIENSINFIPVVIPGYDQKQKLIDMNVNYLTIYDETPVLDTMYVNSEEFTQMSFLHNIMLIQEVIKQIRTRCPRVRYTFLDGSDLQRYIDECNIVINQYASQFSSISMEYMADENYEYNNTFYATIRVKFRNFIQEEYFRVIAIS